jgi:hypothetical protein
MPPVEIVKDIESQLVLCMPVDDAHQAARDGIVTRIARPLGATQVLKHFFPAREITVSLVNGPRRVFTASGAIISQNPVSATTVTFISPLDNANEKGVSTDGIRDTYEITFIFSLSGISQSGTRSLVVAFDPYC